MKRNVSVLLAEILFVSLVSLSLAEGETAYKLKAKNSEYVFINVKDDRNSYLIMKDTKNGLYPENMIIFNEENTRAEMTEDVHKFQEMVEQVEKKHLLKNGITAIRFIENLGKKSKEKESSN